MRPANFFTGAILILLCVADRGWGEDQHFSAMTHAQSAKNDGAGAAEGASQKPPHPPAPATATDYKFAKDLFDSGKVEMAREKLEALAVKSFILGDYAAKDLASILTSGAMKEEALKTLDNIGRFFPRSPILRQVNEQRLRLACEDPVSRSCGERLRHIGEKNVSKRFRPQRELYLAKRKEGKGNIKAAYEMYQKIYYNHPAGPAGVEAGKQIEKIKTAGGAGLKGKLPYPTYFMRMKRVDGLMKAYRYNAAARDLDLVLKISYSKTRKAQAYIRLGEARYKARDKNGSKETLLSFIDKYRDHKKKMEVEYKVAIIDWNLDKNEESAKRLKRLISSGASAYIKKLAYTVLGKISEANEDYETAKKNYSAALALNPKPRLKHMLAWRLGWIEYRNKDYSGAARVFGEAAKKIAFKYRDGKLLYWKSQSLKNTGDLAGADKTGEELARLFPNTFYGTRNFQNNIALAGAPAPGEIDSFYEKVEKIAGKLKFSDRARYHRQRFDTLIDMEMFEPALMELGSLRKFGPKGGDMAMWMALQYRKAKASWRSIRLLTNASGVIKHSFNFDTPFWRVLYPVDHWDVALAQARESAVDPFFILAIIRQESGFNPKAHSPANARGLMQIISSVGEKEFTRNGFARYSNAVFTSDLLFDPELNISIGVKHIAGLIKKYNGNIVYVSAAYNAGAKRVDGWIKRFPAATQDEFIELIPYPETKGYVKRVLKNLALYRLIYGKALQAGA